MPQLDTQEKAEVLADALTELRRMNAIFPARARVEFRARMSSAGFDTRFINETISCEDL